MRCLIAELTPEWGPGSSSVLRLLVMEPWIPGSPPIWFLLALMLPAEKLAMGMKGSGFLKRDGAPLFHPSPCHFLEIGFTTLIWLCWLCLHGTTMGGGTLLTLCTSVMLALGKRQLWAPGIPHGPPGVSFILQMENYRGVSVLCYRSSSPTA